MLLTTAAHWEKPKFPLTGQDVLATGTPAGPMVGKILKGIEDWWVHEDFEPDRVKCLGKLHATISHTQ
jgi:poly(A) polymerase